MFLDFYRKFLLFHTVSIVCIYVVFFYMILLVKSSVIYSDKC